MIEWLKGLSGDAQAGLAANGVLAALTVLGWMLAFTVGRWGDREKSRAAIRDEGRRMLLGFVDSAQAAADALGSILHYAPQAAGDEWSVTYMRTLHKRFSDLNENLRRTWPGFVQNAPLLGLHPWNATTLQLQVCWQNLYLAEVGARRLREDVDTGTTDIAAAVPLWNRAHEELRSLQFMLGNLRDSIEVELRWSWFSRHTRSLARTGTGSPPALLPVRHRLTRRIESWKIEGEWPDLLTVSGSMMEAGQPAANHVER